MIVQHREECSRVPWNEIDDAYGTGTYFSGAEAGAASRGPGGGASRAAAIADQHLSCDAAASSPRGTAAASGAMTSPYR